MGAFLLQRLVAAVAVVWLVTLVVFVIMRALPGDALVVKLGQTGRVSPAQLEAARRALDLDEPATSQYFTWTGGLLRGDFGRSLVHEDRDVNATLGRALIVTGENALLASLVAFLLAVPLAVVSAMRPGTKLDAIARLFAASSLALPSFWVAAMTIALLSRWLAYFPPVGYSDPWSDLQRNLQQHYLPALILGVALAAPLLLLLRASLIEVLRQDYVRTARAKGLSDLTVLRRHAMPNCLTPVIALYGQMLTGLLSGAVIVELLFNLPGLGSLTYQAALERDYTQVEAVALVFAVFTVAVSLCADLLSAYLDPRLRPGAVS